MMHDKRWECDEKTVPTRTAIDENHDRVSIRAVRQCFCGHVKQHLRDSARSYSLRAIVTRNAFNLCFSASVGTIHVQHISGIQHHLIAVTPTSERPHNMTNEIKGSPLHQGVAVRWQHVLLEHVETSPTQFHRALKCRESQHATDRLLDAVVLT
jgi:hypothetical protein